MEFRGPGVPRGMGGQAGPGDFSPMQTAVLDNFRRFFELRSNPGRPRFWLLAGVLTGTLSGTLPGTATAAFASPAQTPAQTTTGNPQTAAGAPQATPAKKPVSHKPKPGQPVVPDLTTVDLTPPPQPELPKWPVNDTPGRAAVVWDATGLRIDASNSSLQQILKEVSTDIGVKVEGLSADERIFGIYGPGQPREVLAQLLNGSSYNVLMIGDQGQGAPRELVLTARQSANAQPAPARNVTNNEEDEVEEPPVVVEPPANQPEQQPRPNRPNGGPPRTPQQIMQEMQQRQQQANPNPQN